VRSTQPPSSFLTLLVDLEACYQLLLFTSVLANDTYRDSMTKKNQDLMQCSGAGDTCILHLSDHGGYGRDISGDEQARQDETLVPLDYDAAGLIIDDDLFKALVMKISNDVLLMHLMNS
jgi:hypothetical protein